MSSGKIDGVHIIPSNASKHHYQAIVLVTFEGSADEHVLFEYFDDELTFRADEFIGLTEQEARDLFRRKDIAYLQSP